MNYLLTRNRFGLCFAAASAIAFSLLVPAAPAFAEEPALSDILAAPIDAPSEDEPIEESLAGEAVDPVVSDAVDEGVDDDSAEVDAGEIPSQDDPLPTGDDPSSDVVADAPAAEEDGPSAVPDDPSTPDAGSGWLETDGTWSYTDPETGEKLAGGFYAIDGASYYFNERGERVSGWLSFGADTYYLDPSDGHLLEGGIFEVDGHSYYFRPSDSPWGPEGSMGKGWVIGYGEESKDYFFDRSSGRMVTGIAAIDGDRFLFGDDGAACGGWSEEGGHAYLFDSTTHRMLSNGIFEVEGEIYYLRPSGSPWGPEGSMGYGWLTNFGGNTFFFDRADGPMLKGGIYPVDESSYYFRPEGSPWGPEGSMGKGWVHGYGDESDDYFFDRSTGEMVTGPLTIDGDRYLFDGDGAAMSGWAWFNGNRYYLGADKKMARGGIVAVEDSNYYFRPAGSAWGPEGSMGSGWVRNLDGQTYFFDRSDGHMLSGGIFGVDGSSYYFRPAGSPWGPEGSMGRGWVRDAENPDEDRFFDRSTGAMLVNGTYIIDRSAYSADSNGRLSKVSNGQLLENASSLQKRIASIAWSEPTTPLGYCAMWVHNVFERYGWYDIYGNACDLYNEYCTSSRYADLQVGMIIAVSSHPGNPAGRRYGHIGIYVGDGVVLDSSGSVRTWYVEDWVNSYNGLVPAKWGWYGGRALS